MQRADTQGTLYRERLVPGPGLFFALALLAPAVSLVMLPIASSAAIPTGIAVYVLVALALVLLSPVIRVEAGQLTAGRATIPVTELGQIELLGSAGIRAAIGPGTDARNYLLIRGWIHRGVRIPVTDPNDPTPAWVVTTRHPQALADAVASAQNAPNSDAVQPEHSAHTGPRSVS